MKKLFSSMFMAAGLWLTVGAVGAQPITSQNITVPFPFKVDKLTLPAGQYRLEREFGKDVVFLVNVNTGHRIQWLRETPDRGAVNARLTFENTTDGLKLLKIY